MELGQLIQAIIDRATTVGELQARGAKGVGMSDDLMAAMTEVCALRSELLERIGRLAAMSECAECRCCEAGRDAAFTLGEL
jgi:hypothetical protein